MALLQNVYTQNVVLQYHGEINLISNPADLLFEIQDTNATCVFLQFYQCETSALEGFFTDFISSVTSSTVLQSGTLTFKPLRNSYETKHGGECLLVIHTSTQNNYFLAVQSKR